MITIIFVSCLYYSLEAKDIFERRRAAIFGALIGFLLAFVVGSFLPWTVTETVVPIRYKLYQSWQDERCIEYAVDSAPFVRERSVLSDFHVRRGGNEVAIIQTSSEFKNKGEWAFGIDWYPHGHTYLQIPESKWQEFTEMK